MTQNRIWHAYPLHTADGRNACITASKNEDQIWNVYSGLAETLGIAPQAAWVLYGQSNSTAQTDALPTGRHRKLKALLALATENSCRE